MTYEQAAERAKQIVRDYTALSIAHGYPPAQTCTLEDWIAQALAKPTSSTSRAGE